MIRTPASVIARVVEHLVREARQAESSRDDAEQDDRPLVGEALVDETVRRVVAAAARDGSPLEQAHDRDECRVEDRHGEDEDREQQRGDGRAGHGPACGEAQRGEPEAEHLAAAVAHEHRRGSAQPEIERQESETGEADAERERGDEMARVDGERVDCEERAGDRGERGREPVHVVEEVERVRHPDQPDDSEHGCGDIVGDDLDPDAGHEHEGRGTSLGGELRERRKAVGVVDQAGDEEDDAAAEDAAELAVRRNEPRGQGDSGGGEQSDHDPAAAEHRRRARVPAICARGRDDVPGYGSAAERPDREQARRQGGECGQGRHGAARLRRTMLAARTTTGSLTNGCKGGVWGRAGRCARALG